MYIEHKIFGGLKSSINFDTHEELDDFVLKLAEKMKKPVTFRSPIVDATLPDGSRINIVYGGDVSKNGSNFTIRKFMGIPLSIVDICNSGMMTWQMAGYMSLIVEEGMNFFVSGETASGKTTLMNALMTFIRPDAKIVSIEDTPEVQVPHPNWMREVVRGQMSQGGGSVDMFSLLKAALRQRPNEIIIGEIRGEEGNIAFQAMMTGHAVCATFHAATVEKLIQRVTGVPDQRAPHVRREPERRRHLQRRAAAERQDRPPHPEHLRDHRLRPDRAARSRSSRCSAGIR